MIQKKILIFCFLLIFVSASASADEPLGEIDLKKVCEIESKSRCIGACLDGWSNHCYYDSNQVTIDPGRALDLQKNKCIGYYEVSHCHPCKNNHLLSENGGLTKVECLKFYTELDKRNKSCNGCIRQFAIRGG